MSGSHNAPEPPYLTPEQVEAWLESNKKLAAMTMYEAHECPAPDALHPLTDIAQLRESQRQTDMRVDTLIDRDEYRHRQLDALTRATISDVSGLSHRLAAAEVEVAALKTAMAAVLANVGVEVQA